MSVHLCIPSIRPNGGTVPLWVERGYKVCLVRQGPPVEIPGVVNIMTDHYLGWAASINLAVAHVLENDPEMEWCVGGGDDTEPDPNHTPEEIARECEDYFTGRYFSEHKLKGADFEDAYVDESLRMGTFGVMQAIGDLKLWPNSRIDTFAGSPWLGRSWCERAHQGRGPMDDRFHHNHGDEALQCVAQKYGVFWQRPDLIHKHCHALREPGGQLPDFLLPVFSPQQWTESTALFNNLKAADWPGCEPLPVGVAA